MIVAFARSARAILGLLQQAGGPLDGTVPIILQLS